VQLVGRAWRLAFHELQPGVLLYIKLKSPDYGGKKSLGNALDSSPFTLWAAFSYYLASMYQKLIEQPRSTDELQKKRLSSK
jgi:hypothetical protein